MKSQQKCIVIFALVCCFAVLVALIFSAVDIWGEDEDGITEENCESSCRAVLVENIPEDVPFADNSTSHLPLSQGLYNLLDQALRVVEIVSPLWLLNSSDYESSFQPAARQGRALLSRLQGLKDRKILLRIASGRPDSSELITLSKYAEVHYLNMTALTKGHLSSSFWVIDNKHFYIGSASMDWRSLATRKELGLVVYNCSCLALDLHKVFNLYWGLQYKDFIPTFWSKRLFALFNRDQPLELTLNSTKARAYVSTSPDILIPKDRSSDLEAISRVIMDARRFIYISITDYLPLFGMNSNRYWSRIDGFIREALLLRKVRVRLLISCWENTHPLTFNFIWSLRSLCMEQVNCSLEAKFFRPRELSNGNIQGINHNRFMVTDRAIYLGNLDWVGNEFSSNAGAGLVISQSDDEDDRNSTIVDQLRIAFERDWFSRHTHSLQANKIPICNKQRTNRLAPLKLPHHGNINDEKPAPIRKKEEGIITRHYTDKSQKNTHQDATGGLVIENYQERGQVKTSHHDNKKLHMNVNDQDSEGDTAGQTVESSGSREICNLPL
ncbi:hypothetical protein WMY93_018856 [Mugilogobius chulae]|uniref:PLD phosphodiesterase domain-containing protein n=1 Tax=Mugilogobius chulae TaxID=88201 RepID=A0AAW0NVC2_9GOBI